MGVFLNCLSLSRISFSSSNMSLKNLLTLFNPRYILNGLDMFLS